MELCCTTSQHQNENKDSGGVVVYNSAPFQCALLRHMDSAVVSRVVTFAECVVVQF